MGDAISQSDLEKQRILDLLFTYMPQIAAERKIEKLLMLMADMGRAIVSADRCSLWLLDAQKEELWTIAAHGVDVLRVPMNSGLVGYTLKTKEPLLIENAYDDPRFDTTSDIFTQYHTRSVMTIPLFDSKNRVIGVYQAINKLGENSVFTAEDLEYLRLTAVYSAKTVESAKLYTELEETQKDIIHILGVVSEFRSKETGEHIYRVAAVSYKIAKYFGLPDDECDMIRLAAPMHDLGKVGVADSILNKPGRLTEDEFREIRAHAFMGEAILKTSQKPLLQFAADIAGSHHEHWNGNGYPRHLAGEEIPLAGRICAIADVLDALCTARCYKPAWSEEQVYEEFKKMRGTQFQPELIDVLFEHWDEIFQYYK